MNTTTNGAFHQFLREEFEKQKDIKKMDVVDAKRKEFNINLNKAHNELRKKSYTTATRYYYSIINALNTDPYPDEYQVSKEMEYEIKCCFCYSSLMSPNRFETEDINSVMLSLIKELNDNFRRRLFPMFLLVLLNFHRKNWLATLTWCREISTFVEEDEKTEGTGIFKELLPSSSQIKCEAETWEELAFFGYGEKMTKNALLKPNALKYKDWTFKLNDYIASKIGKFTSPPSDVELHIIFHQNIFPIWCMTNCIEYQSFYSDTFLTECNMCMRAKLHNAIKEKNDVTTGREKFENFVDHCTRFYQRYAIEFDVEVDDNEGKTKRPPKPAILMKKSLDAPAKKRTSSTLTQTEKIKTNNKYVQTDAKSKSTESLPAADPQVLGALLDIKNKCLTLQEKKDDTISKLNRKINELHEKINKENNARKTSETEFEKKVTNFKFEIQKLKEKLAESEKKYKAESEKNVCLQKVLMEQINDKYNLHKQYYKICDQQARFMVTYLKDLSTALTSKSIPSENTCRMHIGIWENRAQNVQQDLEQFNIVYQKIRADMINRGVSELIWPDTPELPKFEDNLVFLTFKGAIRSIIQTEEQLYYKYFVSRQSQMQRPPPTVPPSFKVYGYNVQQSPCPQPNTVYTGPGLMYSNAAVPMVPYRAQQAQTPKREQYHPQPDMMYVNKGLGGNDPRMSRSVEFLDRSVGGPMNCQRAPNQDVCRSTKKEDNQEMILLDYVMEQCPGTTEEEVTLALLKLLESKNTLSDIPKEQIVQDVKCILRMKKQAAWITPKSPHVDWQNDHTENECAICFEEFTPSNKYTLDCKHEYHKECIKKWLKMSSVCPICRIHSVIDEEFPPLH